MRIRISMPQESMQQVAAAVREALPDAIVATSGEPPRGNADYVVIGHRDTTLFDDERTMKAIFVVGAGVAHVLSLPNLPSAPIVVRLEDAGMTEQMVRYSVAATLRYAQRLDVYAKQQRDRVWRQFGPRTPSDIAVGVLGVGVIGAEIARVIATFGFATRGFSRTRKKIDGVRCYGGDGEFDAFVTGLDVLIAVLPVTQRTTGVLNRSTLSKLARGAHVVNIGRGAHVVDEDLIALLDEGHLSGATLDVFNEEPLPRDHPFWSRYDIAVTPHISGTTLLDRAVRQIATKIGRLESGLPITGIVDRERDYC